MSVKFSKMQAQGNDFVIIDALQDTFQACFQENIQENAPNHVPAWDAQAIIKLCDRRLGIGCDQLLILQPYENADALMLIYNADGSQAANCGNGLRCVADLLMRKLDQDEVRIALADRVVLASRGEHGICVNMGQAIIEHVAADYVDVDMGNLHRVYFKNAVACPERNVEIIAQHDEKAAEIRIVERGAGETLACGSGACATAVAIWHKVGVRSAIIIHMPGGDVVVSPHHGGVYLEGLVTHVFSGVYAAII